MIKRTLQEIADFFGCWVAVDASGLMVYGYHSEPKLGSTTFYGEFIGGVGSLKIISDLPEDWKDSITAPKDSITAPSEPPFREGEVLVDSIFNAPLIWHTHYTDHFGTFRRPTETEWKVLRGED